MWTVTFFFQDNNPKIDFVGIKSNLALILNDTKQTKEHEITPENSPQITTNHGPNGDLSRIHYLEQERRGYKVLIQQSSQPTTSLATQDETPQN